MCVIHPMQAWSPRTPPWAVSQSSRETRPVWRRPIGQRYDIAATDTPASYPRSVAAASRGVKQSSASSPSAPAREGLARHSQRIFLWCARRAAKMQAFSMPSDLRRKHEVLYRGQRCFSIPNFIFGPQINALRGSQRATTDEAKRRRSECGLYSARSIP